MSCNELLIYDVGVQACCCVFFGMYYIKVCCCAFCGFFKSMLLCYHWNVFDIYKQMLSDDL